MERGNAQLKFFDRYLGPFLLLILLPLRLFRQGRLTDRVRSVGLLKTAAIGDTVLVSAIVSDLKTADPRTRVVLFVGGSNAAFAKRIEGIDRLVQLPLTNPLKCIELIRSEKFDLFCDFDAWPRISALLSAVSRAQLRLGFKTAGQYRHYMYDRAVVHRGDRHELENYRELVSVLNLGLASAPQLFGHAWTGGEATVVFHLWPSGTQSHLKEWSPSQWILLANHLLTLGDFSFVLTGGHEDEKRCQEFMDRLPTNLRARFTSRAGCSFDETLRLLSRASLLVSVNTGIMHIGAAMGVPTVGLHGPTNPLRWGPIGPRVRAVSSRMPGAGGLNLGFEYMDETNFMEGLSLDEVFGACRDLLGLPVDPARGEG